MYVKTYERGRVKLKDFEQRLCVYNAVRYIITLFSRGPRRPRYTGVAVYITWLYIYHMAKHCLTYEYCCVVLYRSLVLEFN